jgi:succinyl-diaminopimelate desuccinylase
MVQPQMSADAVPSPRQEAIDAIDANAVVALTRRLIAVDSTNPPGRERPVAELLRDQALAWGLEAEIRPIDEGRANVDIRLPGRGGAPALLYCGHLDTVPIGETAWSYPPFGAEISEGRIFGRGASDMKSGVAAMLGGMAALAASRTRLPGDVRLAGVVGEEVDCAGSRHFLAQGGMNGVGWLVISEPTNLDLVIAHKGALRVEIATHGRAAHGAMPELGINAILHMMELIRQLQRLALRPPAHPLLSPPTLSVNTIAGGFRTNVVPDICRITVDIRTLPGQAHSDVLDLVRKTIAELAATRQGFEATVSVISEAAPVMTDLDSGLVRAAQMTVGGALGRQAVIRGVDYFSDASVLQPPTKVPTILFGPGDDRLAHQINESVSLAAIVEATRVFAALPFDVFAAGRSAAELDPAS